MATNNNPIFYKDLISPDSSIEDLIKAMERLDKEFSEHIANIQKEAKELTQSLQGVSGATEEGRKATKKAATDADKLAEAQRKLSEAQGENAQKLEELREKLRQQNQANKIAVKINNSAEGSYNRLSAQYAENKRRLNAMSQAERDAAEESEHLVTETKELYEKMKDLQEETGKFQLNVGNYTDSIKDALGINNKFGDSILALGKGGNEAKGALAGIKDGAKALGNTLLGLMKNPAFLAIAGVAAAGTAFKFWYDYNAGLVEATRLTQQFTGKQGADLKRFRVEVQTLANTMNKDFQEVLISANAVAKQFGISFDEALQNIQDGFIAGGNASDEYLDILKEYPAYFKEAGISSEQFIAIISQTVKAGIFSDKGIDAIKEANLRIREMPQATADAINALGLSSEQIQRDLQSGAKTSFEVMQMISEKLGEFPEQSAVVGTAIADIFGGAGEDAGLQYLKTLKDISTDLDVAKEKAGQFGKLMEEQIQSENRLQNTISAIFDNTDGSFQQLQTGFKTFINNTLADFLIWIIKCTNGVIDLYNNSFLVRSLWESIVAIFKVGYSVLVNLADALGGVLSALGQQLEGILTFDFDKFKQGFSNFYKAFSNAEKGLRKDLGQIWKDFDANASRKIKPIEIPIITKKEKGKGEAPKPNKGVVIQPKIDMESLNRQILNLTQSEHPVIPVELKVEGGIKGLEIDKKQVESFSKSLNEKIDKKPKDFYDLIGLNISDEKKEAISTSTQFALDQLNQIMEARVQLAEVAVQKAEEETEAAERNLDRELEARANGYASNVELARKEVENAKKNEQKALKDREKAQKQQAAVQTAMQVGNLVTSTSLIWSQLGFPWAIPAIAIMWSSFAAAKIKAAQVTKASNEKYAEGTVELLEGGSHASGHDIDLGTKKDGTRRRAEGGEFFAVINKRNSRKYRKEIPSIINALNRGTFPQNYMQAFNGGDGLNINVTHKDEDISRLSDDVHAIREQGDTRTYTDYDGARVIEYKNLTRRIR